MNISSLSTLPSVTFRAGGRDGQADYIKIINQETKQTITITSLSYQRDNNCTFNLIDHQDFLDNINEDTTLSIIVMNSTKTIPLFRDIIRFRGELDSSNDYRQYQTGSSLQQEYFIYGTPTSLNLLPNSDFSSLEDNILTGFSPNNEDSSVSVSSGVATISGTSFPCGATFDGLSSLSGNKIYKISFTASVEGSSGATLYILRDNTLLSSVPISTTESDVEYYAYALDGESLNISANLGNDLGTLTLSDYSVREVSDWTVSGDEAGSFVYFSGTEILGDTSDYRSAFNLSRVTSTEPLISGQQYVLSGTASDAGNSFRFKQGDSVISEVSESGDFEFTFTSESTDGITIEFGDSIDTFAFSELELTASST